MRSDQGGCPGDAAVARTVSLPWASGRVDGRFGIRAGWRWAKKWTGFESGCGYIVANMVSRPGQHPGYPQERSSRWLACAFWRGRGRGTPSCTRAVDSCRCIHRCTNPRPYETDATIAIGVGHAVPAVSCRAGRERGDMLQVECGFRHRQVIDLHVIGRDRVADWSPPWLSPAARLAARIPHQ